MNWFGQRIGDAGAKTDPSGSAGVGKYLKLDAPLPAATSKAEPAATADGKKKRKLGFGNFDNW